MLSNKRTTPNQKIACLIPDLPTPDDLLPYLNRIHKNRWYSNFGILHKEFEKGLVNLLKENGNSSNIFASLASSGTTALEVALTALQLKPNTLVLVPSLTFPATATAVLRCGLKPLISDVNFDNWQLTPEIAYQLIEKYPVSCVMPVATFGAPVETKQWDRFVNETKIPVIIDAAGAFPFQKIGQESIVAFSFHATKAFGIGEGGGLFLKNEILNKKIKRVTNFGYRNGLIENIGCNGKLSEYHAAVGLAQLKRWKKILQKRIAIDSFYKQLLKPYSNITQQHCDKKTILSLKVIKLPQSSQHVSEHLIEQGIENRRWYYPPLHHHPLFKRQGIIASNNHNRRLEITDSFASSLLGLPFHSFLTRQDISRVVERLMFTMSEKQNREVINDQIR